MSNRVDAGVLAPPRGIAWTRVPLLRRWGLMTLLGAQAAAVIARPPFAWRRECAIYSAEILRRCTAVIALAMLAWGFSGPGLQSSNFLILFGAPDRAGGFMVVAILREFGSFVTGTVVAGVAGTMLTAELGSRRVRGELDALQALGVDPVRALVAPRILALTLTLLGLNLIALAFGVLGGYLAAVVVLGGNTGAFLSSFVANTTPVDLVGAEVKVAIFGLLIGVICSWHGLSASAGAASVGRAVNRAVVGALMAVFVVNLVFTQWMLALYPNISVFR
ncbi:MAG TPA: ABC transporter permease [Solirubrobacteraceae bacterium]|jgi:phospholipid/cholesterol/gamma-HCH transport system permease protein|nr:ABC transporter permease [Solirubrobacteraceae bacterium]